MRQKLGPELISNITALEDRERRQLAGFMKVFGPDPTIEWLSSEDAEKRRQQTIPAGGDTEPTPRDPAPWVCLGCRTKGIGTHAGAVTEEHNRLNPHCSRLDIRMGRMDYVSSMFPDTRKPLKPRRPLPDAADFPEEQSQQGEDE